MRNVLVLGGTGWLGREIANALLAKGDAVTALARGNSGSAPEGVELVRADRRAPDAYDAVVRDWDEVIEISWDTELVDSALAALAPRAAHWSLISTISVYASNSTPGDDESAALQEPVDPTDYGKAKVAVERASAAALDDRLAILRPGLIVGPGDPSDRFGYWTGRFELAGSQPVLTMPTSGALSQVIDVRDLAEFVATYRGNQVINTIGTARPLAEVLAASATAANFIGDLVEAPAEWLVDHEVGHWAGPRSLPLWLPAEDAALTAKNNAAYLAAGGIERDLAETIAAVNRDEVERGLARDRRAGLTRGDELELLAQLAAR